MDLVKEWLVENAKEAILGGGGGEGEELSISGIATYQPSHGLTQLKVVILFTSLCINETCLGHFQSINSVID